MGMCYYKQDAPRGTCMAVTNIYWLRYDSVANMLIAMTTDDEAVVLSNITQHEAELISDEYYCSGKIDFRGRDIEVMSMEELTSILDDVWNEVIKDVYGEEL